MISSTRSRLAAALLLAGAAALLLASGAAGVNVGYARGIAAKIRTPWRHWTRNEEAETREG